MDDYDNNPSKSDGNDDYDNNIKKRTIMIITLLKAMIITMTTIT